MGEITCSGDTHWASLVAQTVKNLPSRQETRVQCLGWEDSWRKEWLPTPVVLTGKSYGQRSHEFRDLIKDKDIEYLSNGIKKYHFFQTAFMNITSLFSFLLSVMHTHTQTEAWNSYFV